MSNKPKKCVMSKNLSGLGGVYDVTIGQASPERRRAGDYSKSGIAQTPSDTFDDYREKIDRWEQGHGR